MSIKKRGNIWYIHFYTPKGQRIRCSANTEDRQTAQELEDELKRRAWRDDKLGEKLTKTWEDACLKWFEEKHEKASIEDDRSRARWLNQHLSGRFLSEITPQAIAAIGRIKMLESSNATANRHLQLLRSILRKSELDWGFLDRAPKVTLYKEVARRVRWITPEQARTLLAELPEHTRAASILALCTGQRHANIVGLMWSQVDMKNQTFTIHGDETKNEQALGVPLNESAMQVLNGLVGQHPTHVISYRGNPVLRLSTRAWGKALKRADIVDFRFHDLRHTWASWQIQNGTPLYDLQEMGNWKDSKMVRKYAHLGVEHLQKHASKMPKL